MEHIGHMSPRHALNEFSGVMEEELSFSDSGFPPPPPKFLTCERDHKDFHGQDLMAVVGFSGSLAMF